MCMASEYRVEVVDAGDWSIRGQLVCFWEQGLYWILGHFPFKYVWFNFIFRGLICTL
jgi:hypothetical protein